MIDSLVSGDYLKSKITPPESGCSYSHTSDLTDDGLIQCDVHGTVEGDGT
jgi:hypothetical protein